MSNINELKNRLQTLKGEYDYHKKNIEDSKNEINKYNKKSDTPEVQYMSERDIKYWNKQIEQSENKLNQIEYEIQHTKSMINDIESADNLLNSSIDVWNNKCSIKIDKYKSNKASEHYCILKDSPVRYFYTLKSNTKLALICMVDIDIPIDKDRKLYKMHPEFEFMPSWDIYKSLNVDENLINDEHSYISTIGLFNILNNINKYYNKYGIYAVSGAQKGLDIIEYYGTLRARMLVAIYVNEIPDEDEMIYAKIMEDAKSNDKIENDVIVTDKNNYIYGDHVNITLQKLLKMNDNIL